MPDELTRLRAFAGWAMSHHTGSVDGCEIELMATLYGLMDCVPCDGKCANCEGEPGENDCFRPKYLPPPLAPEVPSG